MPAKPPRLFPTLALAVLWVALYSLWIVVRPAETASSTTTTTRNPGRTAPSSPTVTVPPLFKIKP